MRYIKKIESMIHYYKNEMLESFFWLWVYSPFDAILWQGDGFGYQETDNHLDWTSKNTVKIVGNVRSLVDIDLLPCFIRSLAPTYDNDMPSQEEHSRP